MPIPITVPRLGWSMEEGVFGEWLKSNGEFVNAGEMLFLLEGEKAAQEIEALDSGVLCLPVDSPKPGAIVKVGQVIGLFLEEGEMPPQSLSSHTEGESISRNVAQGSLDSTRSKSPDLSPAPTRERVAGPAARRLARELGIPLQAIPTGDPTGRVTSADIRLERLRAKAPESPSTKVVATPRARRCARAFQVDWESIQGTGRNGRIRERDILAYVRSSEAGVAEVRSGPDVPGRFLHISKLRRSLAGRMLASVTHAAPVTLTTTVEASVLVAFRESLKQRFLERLPTYNDILIAVVAEALRKHPEMNACWHGEDVFQFEPIHIAIAVDTDKGLMAPVIRNVEHLSLQQISVGAAALIQRAKAGELQHNELRKGTFTVTNLGMFGIDAFTPLLNLPQAGILGVGRIVDSAVVRDGTVRAGKTMALSLTFDHRVIDGAPAARFLQKIADLLQTLQDASSNQFHWGGRIF